jgi:hypothetical protein
MVLELVTDNVVPPSSILVTLMTEAISYSETPVLTRATRRHIPGDGILYRHRRENPQMLHQDTGPYVDPVIAILRSVKFSFNGISP